MNRRGRALGALAVVVALAGCGQDISAQDEPAGAAAQLDDVSTDPLPTSTTTAAWRKAAAWPNIPWYSALTAWSGSEVLIFGGRLDHGGFNGPAPDIEVGQAAGGYNPETGQWRAIGVPPFSQYRAQLVIAGETALSAPPEN